MKFVLVLAEIKLGCVDSTSGDKAPFHPARRADDLSHSNTRIEILTIGGGWVNRVNVQPEWLTVITDGLGSVNEVAKCQTLSHVATCYPTPQSA